jgi:hypothetical protein
MSETLRHKMRSAVFNAFRFGIDKRQHKASLDTTEKIYSITSRNQYLDRINDFCKTCPDVKSVLELTPEAVKRYLDIKAVIGNCTQKTLDDYRHEMKKIGKCMGLDLSCPQVFSWSDPAEDRGAEDVMPTEDFYKIAAYAMEHPSKSASCYLLEMQIGVRVGDIAYGVRETEEGISIRCKNGKICLRPWTPELRRVWTTDYMQKMVDAGGKLRAPKDNSLNKWLRRTEDKLGLDHHSWHSVRRRIAQDKYDAYRGSGMTRMDALSKVSLWLNHGPNRQKMVKKSYVANIW